MCASHSVACCHQHTRPVLMAVGQPQQRGPLELRGLSRGHVTCHPLGCRPRTPVAPGAALDSACLPEGSPPSPRQPRI